VGKVARGEGDVTRWEEMRSGKKRLFREKANALIHDHHLRRGHVEKVTHLYLLRTMMPLAKPN
jgi:hypothetical protein